MKIGDSRPQNVANSAVLEESLDQEVEVTEPEPSRVARAAIALRGASDANIERVLKRRMRGIEQAWREWVKRHPEAAEGTWSVEFTIDESGRVVGVQLKADNLGVPSLAAKLKSQALGWQIPSAASPNRTSVEVTIDFELVP
jgi:hypothetical protein